MTDFEIQRDLRAMRTPRMPERDLWPAIAARIEHGGKGAALPRRRRWIPLAAAAAALVAVVGGTLTLTLRERESSAPGYADLRAEHVSPAEAREQALRSGQDPRLAGANVVLDAARSELQQALEQHPDAVFLVSLLNRTNAQRLKIEQFGARAG